jgi:hypothetical protein
MSRAIVPVKDLGRRMVEHGRIRLGIKSGKAMKSIDTFRFTSADQTAIEQLAEQFGGEAKPWSDPKASPINQFEVITKANEIPVWILPGGLDVSYEMWSGGGCVRRCDGVECETSQQTFDADYEPVVVPCICNAAGALSCKPYTRMSVVIPSIRFGGSWRMESKGWNAAEELPGMVDMIAQMQEGGTLKGRLRLEHRQSQGGRRKFVVPALAIDVSANEILEGSADSLRVSQPVLASPKDAMPEQPDHLAISSADEGDQDVVDAEIVDEDVSVYGLPNAPREPVELTDRQIEGLLIGMAKWSTENEGEVMKA